MTAPDNRIRFQPGSISMTIGAQEVIGEKRQVLLELLRRHLSGDWGDLGDEDKQANDDALKWGDRILSKYHVDGHALYLITERDRSTTTVLTPGEY